MEILMIYSAKLLIILRTNLRKFCVARFYLNFACALIFHDAAHFKQLRFLVLFNELRSSMPVRSFPDSKQ